MPIRQRLFAATILCGVAASVAPTAAHAAAMSASQILGTFDAVIANNVSTGDDIEGPLVAGSLSGGGTFMNLGAASLPAGYGAANIYGSASGQFNANGAKVYVGGTDSATFSGASSVTTGATFPNTLASLTGTLNALSQNLTALGAQANSTLPGSSNPNNAVFNATPGTVNGVANIAIFNITAAQLSQFASFSVNLNGAAAVIFDVSGNYTQTANIQNITSDLQTKVLWNFANATSLSFTEWEGAVLAPNATVQNSSPIEGALYASALNANGELHYRPFVGNLAFATPTTVPEPGSFALLLPAVAGVGVMTMRRRKRG